MRDGNQIVVPFKIDNNTVKRLGQGSFPWERARMRGVIAANGGSGGPIIGFFGRPDMVLADANRVIGNAGGVAEDLGFAGAPDWDFMLTAQSGEMWFNVDQGGVSTITLFNGGGTVVFGMLIFEPRHPDHCPHCRKQLH